MRRTFIALAIMGAMAFAAPPSHAEVGVDVRIGTPPPPPPAPPGPPAIVVEEPPEMVYMPEAGVYVAIGTPYDLYFVSGRYYYYTGGFWYVSSYGYGGPWVRVVYGRLPWGLRRYRVDRFHEFRERQWGEYHGREREFRGKHFRAEGGRGRGEERGRGRGHEKERGRGRDRD